MNIEKKIKYFHKSKKMGIAYLLWFFFGVMGTHNFYIGAYKSGGIQLALSLWTLFFILGGFGFSVLFFFIIWLWWVFDAFLIPSKIKEQNLKIQKGIKSN